MKKNLAIIGASYLQLPLILKAKEMGYTTHVFAWAANDVGESYADFFYPISIVEKDRILEVCKKIEICGICSIASDLAIITVNYVAQALGLTGNTWEATLKSTNKYEMRKAFEKGGNPSPKSYLIDEEFDDFNSLQINFPVIVKPTDRSGSRGIFKVSNASNLSNAIHEAMEVSFEKKVLIEEFIDGQEYSVEYISYKGKHTFLALTLKYTTGDPHFIETGHLEPAPISFDVLNQIKQIVEKALNSLGIKNGASHSEIKINSKGEIYLIEIGGRMGGDCIGSDLVYYSTGKDFVKMVIDVACGKEPDLKQYHKPTPVKVKFILNETDLKEFNDLKQNFPTKIIKVVDFHPENIGKTSDSSNRAGCYIVKVKN